LTAQSISVKDSIILALKTEKRDSMRAKGLYRLSYIYSNEEQNLAIKTINEALDAYRTIGKVKPAIRLHNLLGDIYYAQVRYDRSMESYYKAYHLSDSIKDDELLASSSYNLGWVAALQKGNVSEVYLLYKALLIGQTKGFDGVVLRVNNALGGFYTDQYNKSTQKSDFDSAVKYFNHGINLAKKLKYFRQTAVYYSNMGQLFYQAKDFKTARYYLEKARELGHKDSNLVMGSLHKMSLCDFGEGRIEKALMDLELINAYSIRSDYKELRKDVLRDLAKWNRHTGRFEKAYRYLEEYYAIKAEMDEALMSSSLKNLEAVINYEKSEAKVEQLKQANEIQALRSKRKSLFISVLGVLAFVIIVVAYLLFKQNKLKQESNLKLKEQNKIISEKKEEIEQSINYAKGIQTVFLPDKEVLNTYVANFIFYQPKDVVSGDFYWFKSGSSSDVMWLACADCTGHGVPGALMSMVGINTLEQLCSQNNDSNPDAILKHLNNAIKDSLKQHSDNHKQKDGMDIALLKINKQTKKLYFSGANRPLYLVRNSVVEEIKADKLAIGGYTTYNQSYQLHELCLESNDFIVLSTDGYADQFGGQEGKKFMTKQFKKMLEEIATQKQTHQLEHIESTFNTWKGHYQQVDDVCVIGIRIS
jgi:serine phosphatase RsbU (regulator of sigma subunit)